MKIDINNLKKKYFRNFKENNDLTNNLYETFFGFKEIEKFIKFKNSDTSILEIGCGPAILLKVFSDFYPNINFFGIEPFTQGFEKNRIYLTNSKNIEVNKLKLENYITDKKFDLIYSINVFEHIENWKEYILLSNKLLKKGGINIILCPNYNFPYESHYKIPIIFNKKITKFFFNNKIKNHEKSKNSIGMWDDLNFIKKNYLKKYLEELNIKYYFDKEIQNRIIDRMDYDKGLIERQGLIGKSAIFARKIKFDNFLFNILNIPFPYMKVVIKN
jgi:SAM-dependent methyltransferase